MRADAMAHRDATPRWRLHACDHLEQCGLADAVRAQEPDALCTIDLEIHISEDVGLPVPFADVLQSHHHAPRQRHLPGGRSHHRHLRLRRGWGGCQTRETLSAALRLPGAHPGMVAADECFESLDLFLMATVGLGLLLNLLGF